MNIWQKCHPKAHYKYEHYHNSIWWFKHICLYSMFKHCHRRNNISIICRALYNMQVCITIIPSIPLAIFSKYMYLKNIIAFTPLTIFHILFLGSCRVLYLEDIFWGTWHDWWPSHHANLDCHLPTVGYQYIGEQLGTVSYGKGVTVITISYVLIIILSKYSSNSF